MSDSATQLVLMNNDDDDDGNSHSHYDLARASSGAAFGVVATGWLHYWWSFLEVAVERRIPAASSRFLNTLAKVFIDQLVVSVLFSCSF